MPADGRRNNSLSLNHPDRLRCVELFGSARSTTMISKTLPQWSARDYEKEARAYMASLPLEHFMESDAQGTQRAITLASLALIQARRADFQVYNELLVQYPCKGFRKPRKVVPD